MFQRFHYLAFALKIAVQFGKAAVHEGQTSFFADAICSRGYNLHITPEASIVSRLLIQNQV
jgi:hypothetical protein